MSSGLLPFDLSEVVYEELLSGRRENDGLLHASSHLRGSVRHAQLDVAGAPRRAEGLIRQIPMMTGTLWHDWLQGRLRRLKNMHMSEVDLTPWLPEGWGGTADLFIYHPGYRAFVLVDIKTTKGDSLKWIRRDGAKPEHIWQVSSYWHAAKKSGLALTKEALIWYMPMSDTRDAHEVVEPIECEITPLPWATLRPEMKSRSEARQAYLDSLPFGHEPDGPPLPLYDYLTEALAPVQVREQKLHFDRRADLWTLKLTPHWSARFCAYPHELCDCSTQTENKVGEWTPKGDYLPRKGYEHVVPELVPAAFT